jgi:hypothetical protein
MNFESHIINVISWFLGILVTTGVSIMLYNLLALFFMENPRKKQICAIITACIILTAAILVYRHENPPVVQMKEDVLYIQPKSNQ